MPPKLCDACTKRPAVAKVLYNVREQQRQANSCNECLPIYRAPGSGVIDPVVRSKLCEQCGFKKATKKVHMIDASVQRVCVDCVPPSTATRASPRSAPGATRAAPAAVCDNCHDRTAANAVTGPNGQKVCEKIKETTKKISFFFLISFFTQFFVCTLCTPLMIKKLKEAAMLSAASGRTTMYLPPSGATLGVAASASGTAAAATGKKSTTTTSTSKLPAERAVSHAQLHRSDAAQSSSSARPSAKPPVSKLAASASPSIVSKTSASTRDERRKTVTGAQLKASQSAPVVAHSKPKRGSFTTESTATADIALSTPTVVIGQQSLKPKCVECRLRDATTKVEFDGHQRYVCAKCAERFTALQKALSFDNNDDDRAPPPQRKVQPTTTTTTTTPPLERDIPPTPPMPARLQQQQQQQQQKQQKQYITEDDYGEAPPELRSAVVERVSIPERRVAVTAAYVSDSDDDDDDDHNGYLPLAAGARVLGTMSLSDSEEENDLHAPVVPESPTTKQLRLDTIDSIIGMEPLSDED
jgi:hypothetical protein